MGFHLIGVGFLHGRQAEDIHTEFNRIRPGIDQSVTTSTTTVDRLPSSAETTTGRQYQRRIPSLEGFDTDGVTSSVPRRSTFPFLGDFSSRPRLATQPVNLNLFRRTPIYNRFQFFPFFFLRSQILPILIHYFPSLSPEKPIQ